MRKTGFTLIELLAVIVILAIILLIATPLIADVIEQSRKGAFKNTAMFIVDAAELNYFTTGSNEKTFTITNGEFVGDKLEMNGKLPDTGQITLNEDGNVAMAVYNEKYCAKKSYTGEVVVTAYVEGDCELPAIQGNYFLQLFLAELNSRITTNEEFESMNNQELNDIITDVITGRFNVVEFDSQYGELTLTDPSRLYDIRFSEPTYMLNFLPNVNSNREIRINIEIDNSRVNPRTLSEYNAVAQELPAHQIVLGWNTPNVYSSWDATVNTLVNDKVTYYGIEIVFGFNTTSNQFEAYSYLFTLE